MSHFAKAFLVIFSFSQTCLASSACQGDDCKFEAPQDDESLMQLKMASRRLNETQNPDWKHTPGQPDDVVFSETCLDNWFTNGVNANVMRFMGECLTEITYENSGWQAKGIDDQIRKVLDSGCTGPDGGYNHGKLVSNKGKSDANKQKEENEIRQKKGKVERKDPEKWKKMNLKTEGGGGICSAKVYKPNCDGARLQNKVCKTIPLFRVFNNKANPYSDYWVATDPSTWGQYGVDGDGKSIDPNTYTKEMYREATAICTKWNKMDNIAEYKLNDLACSAGVVFVIGNGERVDSACGAGEKYGYSTALQIGMCPYRLECNPESPNIDKCPLTAHGTKKWER